jgi:hypothetical protein
MLLLFFCSELDGYGEAAADERVEGQVKILYLKQRRVAHRTCFFGVFDHSILQPNFRGVDESTMSAIRVTWVFLLGHMHFQIWFWLI